MTVGLDWLPSLNKYLPKKEVAYSGYFETVFHYTGGAHYDGSVNLKILVKWIEDGRKAGLTIELLSRGVGTGKKRILHHRKFKTTGDFKEFNSKFMDLYDNLQVTTISKIS